MTAQNQTRTWRIADARLLGVILALLAASGLGALMASCAQPAAAEGVRPVGPPLDGGWRSRPMVARPAPAPEPAPRRAVSRQRPEPEPVREAAPPEPEGGVGPAPVFTTRAEIAGSFGDTFDCDRVAGGDAGQGDPGDAAAAAGDADGLRAQLVLLCRLADEGLGDRAASRSRLRTLVEEFPASPYAPRARVFLALLDEIERLRGEVRAQRRRVQKLVSDIDAIKRIDLENLGGR